MLDKPRGLVMAQTPGGELRARLVVILVALAAGFAVAYGFHHQLIDWLNQALPATTASQSPSESRIPS